MLSIMRNMIGFCILMSITHTLCANDKKELSFKNQRGSLMILSLHDEGNNAGSIHGTFTTAVGNCQAEINKPMALSGFYSGNAVSLSVNYPICKKTIAMTGHLSDDKTQLHTLWLVAEESKDPNGKNWNANIVGADQYQLQKN